jgi:hypothetical protein
VLQPAESSWIEPLVLVLYRPTIQLATLLLGLALWLRRDPVARETWID